MIVAHPTEAVDEEDEEALQRGLPPNTADSEVCDAVSGRILWQSTTPNAKVSFRPDGEIFTVQSGYSGSMIEVRDAKTFEILSTLRCEEACQDIEFFQDDPQLILTVHWHKCVV